VKITQTITNSTNSLVPGNCLQAAVATLLSTSLDSVPHFTLYRERWLDSVALWADANGLHMFTEQISEYPEQPSVVFGIAYTPTHHAVVGANRMLVWDPMPNGEGLAVITDAMWFEAKNS
jgi:hypothetical protein